jgi:methylenetetrahydrofolate dehydrogenase (NADP+)/methenyltetrahydrofolate cyclohydrolase
MGATVMDGKEVAKRIRARLAEEVRELGPVGLATVLVGDDPASHLYIGMKHRACEEVGITPFDHTLPATTTQRALIELIEALNEDDRVDGILVQSPLPDGLDETEAFRTIEPVKDIDGLGPFNLGQLLDGRSGHVAATPVGCMTLLADYGVELEGKRAVVIGRSVLVGKPVALLLLGANATVTVCHSRTRDLADHVRAADVVVAAVGVKHLVTPDMVKPGAVLVDVGQVVVDGVLTGDIDPACAEVASLMTPVPGGVGPMTIASLLQNTVRAARFRRGELVFAGAAS